MATVVALVGSLLALPSSTPSAGAGTLEVLTCPTGTVEVDYGFIPPAPAGDAEGEEADDIVTPQVGDLLCQAAFTADGTFTTPAGVTSVDVLVVGAGGGGGAGGVVGTQVLAGGGGAGGQVALFEDVPVTGDIAVTVGTGGAGGLDECDPSCSATGGVDGADGEGSEFGTGGTYAAGGGEGGAGGATLAASPFMTSGEGGSSPSAPLVSVMPVGVTATVSNGGAGGTSSGQLMGPAQNYYSGGGGGAGAGGPATNASVSGCITADGATSCSVSGGDGGVGVVPYAGNFGYSYWNNWFPFWAFREVGTYATPLVEGFGPGGGGGTAGLLLSRSGTFVVEFGFGTGLNLDRSESNSSGWGTVAYSYGEEGSADPYQVPYYVAGTDSAWTSNAYAFGGGGGAAVGNTSETLLASPDSGDGSPGVNGLVVVLFTLSVGIDEDGDGFTDDVDCDDTRPTVNPDATELFGNGLNDDCDPLTPGYDDEQYTCESPTPDSLTVENEFKRLVFSKPEDTGEPAFEGDEFRYLQVGAIGGPEFATGAVTGVSGSSPAWTGTIDVSDTTGLTVGDAVTAVKDVGRLGNGGVYTITSIVDGDTFEFSATDGSSPQVGSITTIRTGERIDAMVTVVEKDTTSIDKLDDWSSNGLDNSFIAVESEAFGLSLAGTVGSITGTGPWTAEITGLTTTDGLVAGARFNADDDGGSIGRDGIYVVDEVLSPTSIRYTATGGTEPVAGLINEFATWSQFVLRIDFLEGGTDTPVTVDDIALSIRDIDDLQYVEVVRPDGLRFESDTNLEIFTTDDLDVVPTDSLRVWSTPQTSSSDSRHWLETRFASTDSITVRLGQLRASAAFFDLDFAPESFESPVECTVSLDTSIETSLTYTGDSGVILAGTPVTLSSIIDPAECTTPEVDYELVYPDGTTQPVTSPLDTSSLLSGIYEIVASYAGDDTCLPSEDRAVLVVTSSADTVTGGGIYHVDSEISGSPRVHFGFTVQKTDKLDRRTSVRTITQRGQLLWINNNEWRLKASLYARWTVSGGIVSGDQPVFGTVPCPAGVGAAGSNPRCGVIVGEGWLERWNPDTLTWDVATDLGDEGWVRFGATVYDGGRVSVCKGKRNCTIVDVADWFGMQMDDIAAEDETGVPVTEPIAVRKQRNGAIVIRV